MNIKALRVGAAVLVAGMALSATGVISAAQFAANVVDYVPGSGPGGGYNDPSVGLGSPDGLTGEGFGFPNVLSPFSPPFESDEIVQIGEGGKITLQLSNYVLPGAGLELGVYANVGISDEDYPNGKAGTPPFTFGANSAVVDVSADGASWFGLGSILFNIPTNYYLDRGPFDTTAGSLVADFGKPFAGTLSDFAGLDYTQILGLLDGSAGGTWLDISGTGLPQVGYIRFSIPSDGNPATDLKFALDGVSLSTTALGSPVPEPSSWLLLAMGSGLLVIARGRRRACGGSQR